MYKQRISYADYVEEVERLYKIERREIYFGFVIRDFIQSILTESEQLVAVWDNKGYKDDTKNPLHKRKNYADSHSLRGFYYRSNNIAIRILQNHMFRLS